MKPEETRDAAEHSWDEGWLDEALARYGAAEPRLGLETRILANLQAQAAQRQRRWIYAFAAAAAAVLFAVLIANVRSPKVSTPTNAALHTQTQPSQVVFPKTGNTLTTQPHKANGQLVREYHPTAPSEAPKTVVSQGQLAPDMDQSSPGPDHSDVVAQEQSAPDMSQSNPEPDHSDMVAQEQSAPDINRSDPAADHSDLVARQRPVPEISISGLSIEPIRTKELTPKKEMD
jgi:hypothetical protein